MSRRWEQRRFAPSGVLPAALLVAVAPCDSLAQIQPDAGRIQQELERGRVPAPAPRPPAAPVIEEPVRPALTAPASARFLVKGFRITRSTAFTETQLLAVLNEFIGKELSLEIGRAHV